MNAKLQLLKRNLEIADKALSEARALSRQLGVTEPETEHVCQSIFAALMQLFAIRSMVSDLPQSIVDRETTIDVKENTNEI